MNNIRRILMALAAFVVAISISVIPGRPAFAAAQEQLPSGTGWDVFINSDGNLCIVTNDKKRTSSIYYKTIGFTVSRGQFNPSVKKLANGAATEYFKVYLGDMTIDTYEKNGREINTFMMPYEDLKARIAACSGDWLQDLTDAEMYGGTCYVRFDSIMVIYHGSNLAHGGHYYKNSPLEGPFDDEKRDLNPREIQSAEPWSAGANTGLRTHFHRWLPIMSAKPMIQNPVFLDHHVTNQNEGGISGPGAKNGSTLKNYGDYSGDPAFAGANTNTEGYNAAEGVPSTKTITGYAEASPWYGGIDVWARMG